MGSYYPLAGIIEKECPDVTTAARFQTANILRGMAQSRFKNLTFRKVLVVVQFSLSIMMIICLTTTFKQFRYIQNKDLGFERNSLLYLPSTQNLQDHFDSFKSALLNNPQIHSVTKSMQGPWNGMEKVLNS